MTADVLQSTIIPDRFTRFRVVSRTEESETIVSFELVPADGRTLMRFRAGQFVVVRLRMKNGETILRNYSLSGDPDDSSRWRISVKQEPAPAGRTDVPPGRGSGHIHRRVAVGDELEIAGPAGDFVCDECSERPVVLLSGGVGLTPMISMLHRLCLASSRRVYFIHACENGAVHAFRNEVLTLAEKRDGILVHFCYRAPREEDLVGNACDSQGFVTRETLQALLLLDDYEIYLCGPPAFMQANWRLLRSLGIGRERIHYEFFGPATVLEEDLPEAPTAAASPVSTIAQVAKADATLDAALTVRVEPSGATVSWDPSCYSLLELVEREGFAPAFNCRIGICGTCVTPLLAGVVEYFEEPLSPPGEGEVLLCCARPVTAVTLEIDG